MRRCFITFLIIRKKAELVEQTLGGRKCVEIISVVFDIYVSSQTKHPYIFQQYSAVLYCSTLFLAFENLVKHCVVLCLILLGNVLHDYQQVL